MENAIQQAESEEPQFDYVDGEDPEVRGPWAIQTITSASWALERVGALEAEIAALTAQEEEAISRIRARAAKLRAQAERGVSFFAFKLAEYATAYRDEILGGGKKKSRTLLGGVIGWRKSGGRLRVEDKAALAAWLETQPLESGLYRIKVEAEMKALQDEAKNHGVIPPGCTWEPEGEDFYVKAEAPVVALVKG